MSSSYFKGLEDLIPSNFTGGPNVFGTQIGNMSGSFTPQNALQGFSNFFTGFPSQDEIMNIRKDYPRSDHFKSETDLKKENKYKDPITNKIKDIDTREEIKIGKSTDANVGGESESKGGTMGKWNEEEYKRINKDYLETVGTEQAKLAQHNFLLRQMDKLPDRMSLGNMMKADAYKSQADRSVTSNLGLMSNMSLPLAGFRYDFQRFG